MIKPQLYVFAGPNGAGKSSVSSTLMGVGTPIFDGDKEFIKLKKTFDPLMIIRDRIIIEQTAELPDWLKTLADQFS